MFPQHSLLFRPIERKPACLVPNLPFPSPATLLYGKTFDFEVVQKNLAAKRIEVKKEPAPHQSGRPGTSSSLAQEARDVPEETLKIPDAQGTLNASENTSMTSGASKPTKKQPKGRAKDGGKAEPQCGKKEQKAAGHQKTKKAKQVDCGTDKNRIRVAQAEQAIQCAPFPPEPTRTCTPGADKGRRLMSVAEAFLAAADSCLINAVQYPCPSSASAAAFASFVLSRAQARDLSGFRGAWPEPLYSLTAPATVDAAPKSTRAMTSAELEEAAPFLTFVAGPAVEPQAPKVAAARRNLAVAMLLAAAKHIEQRDRQKIGHIGPIEARLKPQVVEVPMSPKYLRSSRKRTERVAKLFKSKGSVPAARQHVTLNSPLAANGTGANANLQNNSTVDESISQSISSSGTSFSPSSSSPLSENISN